MVPSSGGWFTWNHIKNDPGRQRHRGKAELIGEDETNLSSKKKNQKSKHSGCSCSAQTFFWPRKKKQEKDEKEDQLCLDRKNDPIGIRTRDQWRSKGYPRISTALSRNTPDFTMATPQNLENLVAPTSAQLSLLSLILSLIFIRYKISFKMMLQPLNLMRFQLSYPRS